MHILISDVIKQTAFHNSNMDTNPSASSALTHIPSTPIVQHALICTRFILSARDILWRPRSHPAPPAFTVAFPAPSSQGACKGSSKISVVTALRCGLQTGPFLPQLKKKKKAGTNNWVNTTFSNFRKQTQAKDSTLASRLSAEAEWQAQHSAISSNSANV